MVISFKLSFVGNITFLPGTQNITNAINVDHFVQRRHSETVSPCHESTIMSNLIYNASPFLFPCTIEYSLICAVILYEMWKSVKSIPNIERTRRNSIKPTTAQPVSAHQFSVDCSRAHRGMFGGIMVIVLTIICLIMYFVLHDQPDYKRTAIAEVIYCETVLYILTLGAVFSAFLSLRDVKFFRKINDFHSNTVSLDNTLLILAQTGVYLYSSFSIIGCFFALLDSIEGSVEELCAEILCVLQTSLQTLFILNASWRRCKGAQQQRNKPVRYSFLTVISFKEFELNTFSSIHL